MRCGGSIRYGGKSLGQAADDGSVLQLEAYLLKDRGKRMEGLGWGPMLKAIKLAYQIWLEKWNWGFNIFYFRMEAKAIRRLLLDCFA